MKYEIYLNKGERVNTGIIVKTADNKDMTGWELIGKANTLAKAKEIFKSLPNCWNN